MNYGRLKRNGKKSFKAELTGLKENMIQILVKKTEMELRLILAYSSFVS